MIIHGINNKGNSVAYEMDDLYNENTSDGVILNPPTTNKDKDKDKKKKKKRNNKDKKSVKTISSKSKEIDVDE